MREREFRYPEWAWWAVFAGTVTGILLFGTVAPVLAFLIMACGRHDRRGRCRERAGRVMKKPDLQEAKDLAEVGRESWSPFPERLADVIEELLDYIEYLERVRDDRENNP